MSQPIQVPLTETSYKTNITTTLDDNTFGLWIIGGCAKSLNNTKRNLKQSQMCGAFPHKKKGEVQLGAKSRPCIAASAENIKELEGIAPKLGIYSSSLCYTLLCPALWDVHSSEILSWMVCDSTVYDMSQDGGERKTSRHPRFVWGRRATWSWTRHVCLSAGCTAVCEAAFGLWGDIFGGDPLSVMGQGHTMGALCKLCWGCAVVGKGPALISARMFSGVCHVWKVIPSLTFPSHNCLRIRINGRIMKKVDQWITLKVIHV